MTKKPGLAVDESAAVGASGAACGRCGNRPFLAVAPWLIIALGIGWATLGVSHDERRAGPSPVTRENFAAIRAGMTTFEVKDLLGSGEVVAEEGYVVDEDGHFRRWVVDGGRGQETEGVLADHDGRPVERLRSTIRYRDGRRSIFVTFKDGEVVDKSEEHLY